MAMVENKLAKIDLAGFNFPALIEREQALEVFQANMEGVEMQFERIKIPSGGALAFEITDESGETQYAKEIIGIILDHYPVNAYWIDAYSGENNPPDCVAGDGKNGVAAPQSGLAGGLCKECQMNQWGTDPQKDGSLGKGKACKNLHRVYFLPEGSVFPFLIALPPTSLKLFHDYVRKLTNRMKPCYSVVTRVKLQKAKSGGGIEYSQVVFGKAAEFAPAVVMGIREIIEQLKPAMRAQRIDATDYDVDAVPPAGQAGAGSTGAPPKATDRLSNDGEPF